MWKKYAKNGAFGAVFTPFYCFYFLWRGPKRAPIFSSEYPECIVDRNFYATQFKGFYKTKQNIENASKEIVIYIQNSIIFSMSKNRIHIWNTKVQNVFLLYLPWDRRKIRIKLNLIRFKRKLIATTKTKLSQIKCNKFMTLFSLSNWLPHWGPKQHLNKNINNDTQ